MRLNKPRHLVDGDLDRERGRSPDRRLVIGVLAVLLVSVSVWAGLREKAAYIRRASVERYQQQQAELLQRARASAVIGNVTETRRFLEQLTTTPRRIREALQIEARVHRLANVAAVGSLNEVRKASEGLSDADVTRENLVVDVLDAPAWHGRVDVLKYLLDRGWRPDGTRRSGDALRAASGHGHLEAVTLLLGRGAHPDLESKGEGYTALMYAIVNNHMEVARILLQHGADPRYESAKGETPISLATRYRRTEILKLLASGSAAHPQK